MKKILMFFLVLTGIYACRTSVQNSSDLKELKRSNVAIQVRKIQGSEKDEVLKYGVRIFPDKTVLAELGEKEKEALWYKMDSSFYLQSGNKKFYAFMTEPISNGQKNNFEYLLMFDLVPGIENNDLSLAFNDKYISHKIHQIKLNTN